MHVNEAQSLHHPSQIHKHSLQALSYGFVEDWRARKTVGVS